MIADPLAKLLAHPNPGFVCVPGAGYSTKGEYVVRVEHRVNRPAGARLLSRIPEVPGAEAARRFYAAHNGAAFYTRRGSMERCGALEGGIEIFPIAWWPERTAQMVESWVEGGYADREMPYGRDDFIAFAHADGASSHVHWVVKGPAAGSVYWWAWTMPPQRDTPPLARDFGHFVELICTEPVRLLNEIFLCYTRFSDDKTVTEWIPSRYLQDCGA